MKQIQIKMKEDILQKKFLSFDLFHESQTPYHIISLGANDVFTPVSQTTELKIRLVIRWRSFL
jgi:hypothetical protein